MKFRLLFLIIIAWVNYRLLLPKVGPIGIILTILVSLFLYLIIFKKHKLFYFLFLGSFITTIGLSLTNEFDRNMFRLSGLESHMAASRTQYFVNSVNSTYGKRVIQAYVTRIRPPLTKFNINLFSHLDFNSFFIVDNLISLVFLILFVLGFVTFLKLNAKLVSYYFLVALFVGGLLTPTGVYGRLIFLPLVNVVIVFGLYKLKDFLRI